MIPALYTTIVNLADKTLTPTKYASVKQEVINFFENTKIETAEDLNKFVPSSNIVEDFKNGMIALLDEKQNSFFYLDGFFKNVFLGNAPVENDGLNYPPEAMKVFTDGLDINLDIFLPDFYLPSHPDSLLTLLVNNLGELFKNVFRFPFSFNIPLFGDKVATKVTAYELVRENHSGLIPSTVSGYPNFGSVGVHLTFKAKIRAVVSPKIMDAEKIREELKKNDGFAYFIPPFKVTSYNMLSWMYALIFHRSEFKVFKYLNNGYILFSREEYEANPNFARQTVLKILLKGYMQAQIPDYPKDDKSKLTKRIVDGSNTCLPAIMDCVKNFCMEKTDKNFDFHYRMPEGGKGYAKFGSPGYGGNQELYVEVGFTDRTEMMKTTRTRISMDCITDLIELKKALVPFLECIDKTRELLEKFTEDVECENDAFTFVANSLVNDIMVDPTNYTENTGEDFAEDTLEHDTLKCVSDISKEIIGS